jgi:type IV pilus assembly protein PilC
MAQFIYKALNKSSQEVQGRIEAGSESVVVERLRNMGYFPTVVRKIKKDSGGDLILEELPGIRQIYRLISGGQVRLKSISAFTRQLATLIGAGLPLLRSLQVLADECDSTNLKHALIDISQNVEQGATFSEALSAHPRIFRDLYVNMVRAGEIGGDLEEILQRLAAYFEKSAAVRSKVLSALYYPAAVVFISILLVSLILLFIVPRFQELYQTGGKELPAVTQVLVDASYAIRYRGHYVLGGVALFFLLLWQIKKTRLGRMFFDHTKLKLPLFGQLAQKVCVARFARTFSSLLKAGVPILDSLTIVKNVSGNEVLARATIDMHESIREGDTITEPMRRSPVFPNLVVHMVAVGEETGAIDQMLGKVADAYEQEVDHTIDGLTALIEPLLIVFLGIFIGFIVIALYMPILNIIDLFNN